MLWNILCKILTSIVAPSWLFKLRFSNWACGRLFHRKYFYQVQLVRLKPNLQKPYWCWNPNLFHISFIFKQYNEIEYNFFLQIHFHSSLYSWLGQIPPPLPQFCSHFNERYIHCCPAVSRNYGGKTKEIIIIIMKDTQCAKSNEKSIFQFLFFELSWKFIENWAVLS